MKNMWKFILSLVLAAAMLFCFCACAKKDGEETQTETGEVTEEGSSPTDSGGSEETPPTGGNEGGPSKGDGGKTDGQMIDMKLMSFNIRYQNDNDTGVKNWSNRREAVAEFIATSGVDVICMQEVMPVQYDDLKKALSDKYELLFFGSNGSTSQANVIGFDKTKWSLIETDLFWLSETPDIPSKGWGASNYRICCFAKLVHIQTSSELNVYNVHLDHKETTELARVNGIQLVLDRISARGGPTYLGGDFNCYSNSDAYKKAAAAMNDSMVTSPVTDSGDTYQNWGKTSKGSPIDFNFFSKEHFETLTFEICRDKWGENNENYLSDHYAIKSTVKLKCVSYVPEPVEPLPDLGNASGTNGEDGDYTQNY